MDFRFGSNYGSKVLLNLLRREKSALIIEPILARLSDEELRAAFYSLEENDRNLLDSIISPAFIKRRAKKASMKNYCAKLRSVRI